MYAALRSPRLAPVAAAALVAIIAADAPGEDLKSPLGDEIERRFAAAPLDMDESPLEFGCNFSKYIARDAPRLVGGRGGWYFSRSRFPGDRFLEEPASLPQPTLVETCIDKGFPTGEGGEPADDDDSYYLAKERMTFGGIGFSR